MCDYHEAVNYIHSFEYRLLVLQHIGQERLLNVLSLSSVMKLKFTAQTSSRINVIPLALVKFMSCTNAIGSKKKKKKPFKSHG